MDSLTHIVLGACIGEAVAGKKLGKKAMFIGALAQSIPDIDFVASFWNDTSSNLLAHRGFTHSLLFMVLATVFFALLAEHYQRHHKIGYRKWLLFFALEIAVHLFLDLFNGYGMGLLEPFSHQRFSVNTVFVADPFFSVWPAITFTALLVLKRNDKRRKYWWRFAVIATTVYLGYCITNKLRVDNAVKETLEAQHILYTDYLTTPTPLNNWLWYVVVKDEKRYYVGYRSVFDGKKPMTFHYFTQNDSLLALVKDHEEVQHLLRFSQGYYTVEKRADTIVFNDLRFGQIVGWYNPVEQFVFQYYLQHPEENKLVVQRGRFAKWNKTTIKSLIKRIRGV